MSATEILSSNALLSYAMITNPAPLQVSHEGESASRGALNIAVSNDSGMTVNLYSITVQIPVGSLAMDLASSDNGISVAVSPSSDWQASYDASSHSMVVTPKAGAFGAVSTDGLHLSLSGFSVTSEVGVATVTVVENATQVPFSGSTPAEQNRIATFGVAKFPESFYLNEFYTNTPQINIGSNVTLIWDGSEDADYELTWDGQTQNVTGMFSYVVPGLVDDTSFTLSASMTVNGEVMSAHRSLTVIVQNNKKYVPQGLIALWSTRYGGTTLPAGWVVCDGTDSRAPNLSQRFVVAASSNGSGYSPDSSGGPDSHSHGFSISNTTFTTTTDGSHTHKFPSSWYDNKVSSGNRTTVIDRHAESISDATTRSDGDHSHRVTVGFSNQNTNSYTNEIRPRWYALYYIMKVD